jgi:hypothetical protein
MTYLKDSPGANIGMDQLASLSAPYVNTLWQKTIKHYRTTSEFITVYAALDPACRQMGIRILLHIRIQIQAQKEKNIFLIKLNYR